MIKVVFKYQRGKVMAKSCLHILTNNEYATTRCQDGIVLFWPIDGEIELQKFRKSKNN